MCLLDQTLQRFCPSATSRAEALLDGVSERLQLHQRVPAASAEWACRLHASLLGGNATFPSTGFAAIALGIAIARRIRAPPPSVFGFGSSPECAKYYDCFATKSDGYSTDERYHAFETEATARMQLHDKGLI
eukprot:1131270-Prymnesium_polylepis.1